MQASLFKFDASKKPKRYKIIERINGTKSVIYESGYDITGMVTKYPNAEIFER